MHGLSPVPALARGLPLLCASESVRAVGLEIARGATGGTTARDGSCARATQINEEVAVQLTPFCTVGNQD